MVFHGFVVHHCRCCLFFVLDLFHITVVGNPSPLSCVFWLPHHQLPLVVLYWLGWQHLGWVA